MNNLLIHPTLKRSLAQRAYPVLIRMTERQRERALRRLLASVAGLRAARLHADDGDGPDGSAA